MSFNEIMKKFNGIHRGGHKERLKAVYDAVSFIIDNNIEGDFVECGVAAGYSSTMMALTLKEKYNITDRRIWMYDVFDECYIEKDYLSECDISHNGISAIKDLEKNDQNAPYYFTSVEDVQKGLDRVNYNNDNFIFVKGRVEDTIPLIKPEKIALLRLDTDFYKSTKYELETLEPLLVPNGYFISDDYGHWLGAQKAVNDYFGQQPSGSQMVDYTCLVWKKI